MRCDFIVDGDLEIKTTLGRVVLFVINSVMLILVQNSGAFAAATFPDSTDTFTSTHPNANLCRTTAPRIDVPVIGCAHLTSPYTVAQQDVELGQ